MKLTPFQLALLAVGGFATVIGLNILAKYQSSEDFRDSLKNMSPGDLINIRARRVAEENMQPVAVAADTIEDDDDESE